MDRRQFTLRHLFWAIGFVCICIVFVRSEGCGYHWHRISCIAFTPDEANLVVGCYDARRVQDGIRSVDINTRRTVKIISLDGGDAWSIFEQYVKRGQSIGSHWGPPEFTQVTPDGKAIASVDFNGEVTLRDIQSRKALRTIRVYPGASHLVFSPNGMTVATNCLGGPVVFTDLASKRQQMLDSYTTSISFSPTANHIALGGFETVQILDAKSLRVLHELGMDEPATARFSPDGKILATRDGRGVKLWDASLAKPLLAISEPTNKWQMGVFNGPRRSMRFSPDGTTLATIGASGLRFWDVETGHCKSPSIEGATFIFLAYSPSGNRIATANASGTLEVWDTSTGAKLWSAGIREAARLPFYIPLALLVGWCMIGYKFRK